MLPAVLEVYVVWHPKDTEGEQIARQIFDHFHGTAYSGLIGGAIEVYTRSDGWRSISDAPRPVSFPNGAAKGESAATRIAIVPILGTELAAVVESDPELWRQYVCAIAEAGESAPSQVGVFPVQIDKGATDGTQLGNILTTYQQAGIPYPLVDQEEDQEARKEVLCRDLAQAIAQLLLGPNSRLTVFISHTRRAGPEETKGVMALIRRVLNIVSETRLASFFDARDLQSGRDWGVELRTKAGQSALLAIRTDLYATRSWCQEEMLIAKQHGMPVVVLDALIAGEERGSFIMDHVPRFPAFAKPDGLDKEVRRALNSLVDECLKRELWKVQQTLTGIDLNPAIAWWAPHAPEPVTLLFWMADEAGQAALQQADQPLRILHPDPPLGECELKVLESLVAIAGHKGALEVMTPRILAARGV